MGRSCWRHATTMTLTEPASEMRRAKRAAEERRLSEAAPLMLEALRDARDGAPGWRLKVAGAIGAATVEGD